MEEKNKEEIEKVENLEENEKQEQEIVEKEKQNVEQDKKGYCIAALVLGIIALIFSCVFYLSLPCAILAIVFGIIGIKSKEKGMAVAGLITGAIGLLISISIIIFVFVYGITKEILNTVDELDTNYKTNSNVNFYN